MLFSGMSYVLYMQGFEWEGIALGQMRAPLSTYGELITAALFSNIEFDTDLIDPSLPLDKMLKHFRTFVGFQGIDLLLKVK